MSIAIQSSTHFCRCRFSLHDRPLPAKTLAEHARLECGGIRQASDVADLAIAKIERGLRDSGAALVSMRPDQITVSFRHRLAGTRGDAACQQMIETMIALRMDRILAF
jgi:hypothetical protein